MFLSIFLVLALAFQNWTLTREHNSPTDQSTCQIKSVFVPISAYLPRTPHPVCESRVTAAQSCPGLRRHCFCSDFAQASRAQNWKINSAPSLSPQHHTPDSTDNKQHEITCIPCISPTARVHALLHTAGGVFFGSHSLTALVNYFMTTRSMWLETRGFAASYARYLYRM